MRTFDKRKTCKLSVRLMKVCRKSTRFYKRFRQNLLGLAQRFARIHSALDKHLRESTRLLIKGLWESTRLSINICENPLGLVKHLRESTWLSINICENPLGFIKNLPKSNGLIMSGISGPDTMGMTFLIRRRVNARCLFLETCGLTQW